MENGMNVVGTIVDYRRRDCDDYGRNYRGREYDSCLDEMIANGVQRLQHDVADQSSKVGDKINAAMAQDNANARSMEHMICATERNLAEGQREVQRDVVENKNVIKDAQCSIEREVMQNRVDLLKTESKLIERLDYETDIIKERLTGFERSVDHQFCAVKGEIKESTQTVLNKLCDMENERKNDLIAELRASSRNRDIEISIERSNTAFSSQLQAINSQLIHLDNSLDNKITNKIVQIGAGLVAAPVSTANNVR